MAESRKTSSTPMNSGSPFIFKLPLEKNDIGIDGCKSYTFGPKNRMKNRTVIFLGETGSGKSTLINGMINSILGVDWKDSFRFKLIDEGQLKSKTESQTSHVTSYKVNHQDGFRVPYSLTLVDTPGFGDSSGMERDRAITEQIRRLFTSPKGVCEIDAVCFVTQASLARLTATQKYVFDSVLSVFGKDVADNISILVTFADSQKSPVLEAINAAEIPCPKTNKGLPVHHKFNNSALFADKRSVRDRADEESDEDMEDDKTSEMFWEMGDKSMKRFFTALDKLTPRKLQLTENILTEHRQPEAAVEVFQPKVRAGLAKPEEIRSTQRQRQPEAAVEVFQPKVRAGLAKPEEIRSTQRQRQPEAAVEVFQPKVRAGLAKPEEIRSTQRQRQPEAAVEVFQPKVWAGLAKPEEIRSTQQIKNHDATIPSNENLEGMVEIPKPVQITQKKGGTKDNNNIQQRSVTSAIRYPYAIEDHSEKRGCAAMSDVKSRL
ncbi:unnamed protein product [Boreogadus saida]